MKMLSVKLLKKSILTSPFIFLCFAHFCFGQTELQFKKNLKKHILYLADDKLEGRATGSEGEQLAYEYIIQEFKEMGVTPRGEKNTYLQRFEFTDGYHIGEQTKLSINDKELSYGADYLVWPHSASGTFDGNAIDVGFGIEAPQLGHNDYKDKKYEQDILIMQISSPDQQNPHSEIQQYTALEKKLEKAIEKGAKAVLLLADETDFELTKREWGKIKKVTEYAIPVILLHSQKLEKYFSSVKNLMVKSLVDIEKKIRFGNNVLGFVDNKADATVVFGAHYDHLGYGEFGSLHTGKSEIHNGADDNASGVALVIEIARFLSNNTTLNKNNYLFALFSGEELGLYGSNYYTKNSTIPLENLNCMFNFDMVGRLDSSLAISGTGTSPFWETAISTLDTKDVKLQTKESGIGPSDHTSFYINDVPVLHFFSGAHNDYHKPSDDEDKINYDGIVFVGNVVKSLVENVNSEKEQLVFTKTKEENNSSTPRFTVGLGVIPDYLFDGEGMRIDGISEGKVADKAGLEEGDIVIQLGEVSVRNLNTYMEALSKFQKGDSTTVEVKRKDKTIKKKITFF